MVAPLGAGIALNPGDICDGHFDSLATLLAVNVHWGMPKMFPSQAGVQIASPHKPFSHAALQRVRQYTRQPGSPPGRA